MSMICKKCGTNNMEDSIYCIECGAKLENKVKKKGYLYFLSFVLVVIIVAIIFFKPLASRVCFIVAKACQNNNLDLALKLAEKAQTYYVLDDNISLLYNLYFNKAQKEADSDLATAIEYAKKSLSYKDTEQIRGLLESLYIKQIDYYLVNNIHKTIECLDAASKYVSEQKFNEILKNVVKKIIEEEQKGLKVVQISLLNLDKDKDNEMLTFCSDTSGNKKIIIYDKTKDTLVKNCDVDLEFNKISDVKVENLINDGLKQIVIQVEVQKNNAPVNGAYVFEFGNNELKLLFTADSYVNFEINDNDSNGTKEIICTYEIQDIQKHIRKNIYKWDGKSFSVSDAKITYKEGSFNYPQKAEEVAICYLQAAALRFKNELLEMTYDGSQYELSFPYYDPLQEINLIDEGDIEIKGIKRIDEEFAEYIASNERIFNIEYVNNGYSNSICVLLVMKDNKWKVYGLERYFSSSWYD